MVGMFQLLLGSSELIEREFASGTSSIPRLLQYKGGAKKRRKIHPGRPPVSPELDQAVFNFLEEERSEGRVVTNKMLLRRAREIAGGMGIIERFKASPMWLRCWKRRFGVGMRSGTNASQKVPADFAELLQDFCRSIIQARKVHKVDPSDIINMDQTMVRFDMPRSKTNNVRGKKDIRIKTTKDEKKGFTVALAATATGEKLPAVIFFKEKGGSLCKLGEPSTYRTMSECVQQQMDGRQQ